MQQTAFVVHKSVEIAIGLVDTPIIVDCEDFKSIYIAAVMVAEDFA